MILFHDPAARCSLILLSEIPSLNQVHTFASSSLDPQNGAALLF